jgi:hypothetical protein
MKTLWFKSCMVPDILEGRKTDTFRRAGVKPPAVGETIAFAVGPRRAFAMARVTATRIVKAADLSQERRQIIEGCLCTSRPPREAMRYLQIEFVLLWPALAGKSSLAESASEK